MAEELNLSSQSKKTYALYKLVQIMNSKNVPSDIQIFILKNIDMDSFIKSNEKEDFIECELFRINFMLDFSFRNILSFWLSDWEHSNHEFNITDPDYPMRFRFKNQIIDSLTSNNNRFETLDTNFNEKYNFPSSVTYLLIRSN